MRRAGGERVGRPRPGLWPVWAARAGVEQCDGGEQEERAAAERDLVAAIERRRAARAAARTRIRRQFRTRR